MKRFVSLIFSSIAFGLLYIGSSDAVFAATVMPVRGVTPVAVTSNSETKEMDITTGDIDSKQEIAQARQKTIDDVNTFLIESYKIKLDKILDDVYQSIRDTAKDDPKIQIAILKRVVVEIDGKLTTIESRNLPVNRKKILTAVFQYLKTNLETKIASISEAKE